IRLPQSMSDIQNYIDQTSKTYQTITESFMKVNTLQGLASNLLIVAIIPALGEEFLFRGVLQCIFSNWTRNVHWGILISSFVFSAIHMEFYGFFPRWILGIMFGYFLIWSGSLWLPILAHFLNNAIAVITYYLISNGLIKENMADIGSTTDFLPFTIICCLFTGAGIYLLYKKKNSF
ncbi:MAG TPA: CPBP family intramembrane glutamic endopeptidase, partial [Bacteroidales bacterium]